MCWINLSRIRGKEKKITANLFGLPFEVYYCFVLLKGRFLRLSGTVLQSPLTKKWYAWCQKIRIPARVTTLDAVGMKPKLMLPRNALQNGKFLIVLLVVGTMGIY